MLDDFGFDKLLDDDGLVARLLGKTRSGRNRKLLHGPDLPVLLLVGGPGTGKGRLLRCVRGDFGRHVPVAQLDCALTGYGEEAAQHPRSRSELTEALREIALQLGAWQGDGGGIPAPRLYAGLAAVAASDRGGTVADVVDEVRRHDDLLPPGHFWRGVLNRAVRGYLGALAGLVTHAMAVPLINGVLDELLARTSREGEAALRECYGEYPGAGGHAKLGLHSLAAHFQQDRESRETAENFLFRALREDIEAAYRSVRGRMSRVGRPALLLDHADNVLGRRLLGPVLEDRENGHHDRLVIFATARRDDGGRFLHRAGGADDSGAAAGSGPLDWHPAAGGLPAWSRPPGGGSGVVWPTRGVVLVRMPLLTREQQKHAAARLQLPRPETGNASRLRVELGIHRLSGGRPLFVTRLAEATAAARLPADGSDWALLECLMRTGDEAEARPVADVLLEELVGCQLPEELPAEHRAHWLDLLSHLSTAHDAECAEALMRERQKDREERLSAYRIAELLRDSGWPHCPRHFIGDLGLRHLLMRRLYRLEPGGAAWQEDHKLLRDRYGRPPYEDAPDDLFGTAGAHRMHHHLAFADTDTVTDYLERTFPSHGGRADARSMREWCEELLAIAEAPLIGGPDDRRDRALGAVEVPGDARRRRIDRLLHAVRLCEDPTRQVDDAVAGTLRKILDRIGDESSHGAEVLTRVAGDWSDRVAGRQPLRPCACTRHIG